MNIIRQGDVLLVATCKPATGKPTLDGNDIILAYGEVTGHAHRIAAPKDKAVLWDGGAERFLQVMDTVALTHEEHTAHTIAPGMYQVFIQIEYTPGELRNVAD